MAVEDEHRRALLSGHARAIADGSRRRILEMLVEQPDMSVQEVCDRFDTSRFAVMKHLNILEDAGLVSRRRVGTTKYLRADPRALRTTVGAWIEELTAPLNSNEDE